LFSDFEIIFNRSRLKDLLVLEGIDVNKGNSGVVIVDAGNLWSIY
jgi:hypothetical protein